MDLSIDYMGLHLKSPLMPGASPMVDDLGLVKRLEDAGAGAIVMHSLFEEQISGEKLASIYSMELYADSYAEAMSYFPSHDEYTLGPEQYLQQLGRIKKCVDIPVIASLNGCTQSGWIDYAQLLQQAGADAIELNTYFLATDPQEDGAAVEARVLEIVREVARRISIPFAVKLSPFYSSLPNFASRLDSAGADGACAGRIRQDRGIAGFHNNGWADLPAAAKILSCVLAGAGGGHAALAAFAGGIFRRDRAGLGIGGAIQGGKRS